MPSIKMMFRAGAWIEIGFDTVKTPLGMYDVSRVARGSK